MCEDPAQWNLTAQNCTGPVGFTTFVNQQLNSYWKDSASVKSAFLAELNTQLADYVANKALDGLFDLVKQKELGIRSDFSQRTSSLLKKVFAKQD